MPSLTQYVDRETGAVVTEDRHNTKILQYLYSNACGAQILRRIARKHIISRLYGWWYNRKVSVSKLEKFVKRFGIDMRDVEKPLEAYTSCNEVFTRRLKTEARPVQQDPTVLVSPADGYVLVTTLVQGIRLSIKGGSYALSELLQDSAQADEFQGGNIAIFRLAPLDYHRFHFPDSGIVKKPRTIKGHLYSVSNQALEYDPSIFCHNRRDIVEFNSNGFGRMLLVPVGATFVGRIVETYTAGAVTRGQEQGYFEIGGSSIVMVLEKDKLIFDEDLLANSRNGLETSIKMGTRIGCRKIRSNQIKILP